MMADSFAKKQPISRYGKTRSKVKTQSRSFRKCPRYASNYGVLQEVIKIDEKDGDANTYANNKLSKLNKVKESFSIEIIEAVNSYTRAGSMITVDNANYLIESTDHSIKNGIHYVKLGLRKFG